MDLSLCDVTFSHSKTSNKQDPSVENSISETICLQCDCSNQLSEMKTTQEGNFKVGDILSSGSSRYQIKGFRGIGGSAIVAKCIKLGTEEMLALKIFNRDLKKFGKREVDMYENHRELDRNQSNLIRFIEHFTHKQHVCLVLELLDMDLSSLIEMSIEPLGLSEIRVISQQMLVTLNALKSIQMIHGDIKPDNIMLVDQEVHPFKVKLIDFGFAFLVSELSQGMIIQTVSYRAPEVILGLPLNEAVDMWALGCVLAFLYLGEDLYPYELEDKVLRDIVQMQGMPEHRLLKNGLYARDFFEYNYADGQWRLKPYLSKAEKGFFDQFNSLDDLARPEVMDGSEYEDTQAFISLLKMMLQVDPKERITPREALEHPFITGKHFHGNTEDEVVESAGLTIKTCQLEQSAVEEIEEIAANMNNGPLVIDGLHGDDETTGFVKVKNRKRSFKIIHKFFSRIFKSVQSQQSSSESKCFLTSSEEICWNGTAISSFHDPLSAETVNTNMQRSATADLHDTTIAGINEELAGTNKEASPASVNLHSDGINTSDDETTNFIEVKTRMKWFKRINGFLSWMLEAASCCTCF